MKDDKGVYNWPFVVFFGYLLGIILAKNILIEFSYIDLIIVPLAVYIFLQDDEFWLNKLWRSK